MSDDRTPPGGTGDEDFDRIVAGLELSLPEDLAELDAELGDESGDSDHVVDGRDDGEDRSAATTAHDENGEDDNGEDETDEDEPEERFVPPEPGPLPPLDTVTRVAWAVLFGAPAVLLVAVIFAWQLPRSVTGLFVLGFVGALVLLLVKRGNDDQGDDPDNGAVI